MPVRDASDVLKLTEMSVSTSNTVHIGLYRRFAEDSWIEAKTFLCFASVRWISVTTMDPRDFSRKAQLFGIGLVFVGFVWFAFQLKYALPIRYAAYRYPQTIRSLIEATLKQKVPINGLGGEKKIVAVLNISAPQSSPDRPALLCRLVIEHLIWVAAMMDKSWLRRHATSDTNKNTANGAIRSGRIGPMITRRSILPRDVCCIRLQSRHKNRKVNVVEAGVR